MTAATAHPRIRCPDGELARIICRRVHGSGVPAGTVRLVRSPAGLVTCDHYQVPDRRGREPGNLQILKMAPRWAMSRSTAV